MRLAMGFANCLARSCDSCAAAAVEPMAAIASARIGAAILQDVSLVTTSRVARSLPLHSLEPCRKSYRERRGAGIVQRTYLAHGQSGDPIKWDRSEGGR